MAKKQPTNSDLAKKVDEGFKAVGVRLDTVENKVQTFHDFMIVQKDRDIRPIGLALSPEIKILLGVAGTILAAFLGVNASK